MEADSCSKRIENIWPKHGRFVVVVVVVVVTKHRNTANQMDEIRSEVVRY